MNSASIKAYKGIGMNGMIAKWYAANTRKSIDEYKALARQVAEELAPGSRVLELTPGPGYFAIELAKLGDYRITGVDISKTFVEIAQRNATEAGVEVDFQLGDAANMPFENEAFDFLFCRAAFKNFAEPLRALNEMHRVLSGGGRGLIIDLRRDSSRESINEEADKMGLSLVNTAITKLIFRFVLLKRAYTKSEFQQFFSQTNFRALDIREYPIGLEIRLEK
ncbi:MAG: class I SAM-dependent methyltransferase [Acidobacteria bacterium]|nr:class I SAM-dependent methyltransferase [Acidobacteriota bacterium]